MDKPALYQIRVKGHLDESWQEWFGGLAITNLEGGEAILLGRFPDQAALYGVLSRINSLGLTLISINVMPEDV